MVECRIHRAPNTHTRVHTLAIHSRHIYRIYKAALHRARHFRTSESCCVERNPIAWKGAPKNIRAKARGPIREMLANCFTRLSLSCFVSMCFVFFFSSMELLHYCKILYGPIYCSYVFYTFFSSSGRVYRYT